MTALSESMRDAIEVAVSTAESAVQESRRTVGELVEVLDQVIANNNDLARRYAEQNLALRDALHERDELQAVLDGRIERRVSA